MTLQITRNSSRGIILIALLGVLTPRLATAATPGVARGTVMIGAERLFGLSNNRTSTDVAGGGTDNVDHTGFGLFLSSPTTVHMLPRVAVDYALIDGLTLGGSFGFFIGDRDDSTTQGGTTRDVQGPTTSTVLFAPRVGYALGLNHVLSLWIHAGVTYYRTNSESSDGVTSVRSSGLTFDVEPTLIVKPFDHFGFTAGAVLDLPLVGTQTTETTLGNITMSTSRDQTIRNLGIVVGMLGTF